MRTEAIDRTRRSLLRGRRPDDAPKRPPWTDDNRIADACTRCGACIDACPEAVLRTGDGGFPEFDPALGGCTFCGACADACPAPVFEPDRRPAWTLEARIDDAACLAHAGIHCEICRDACPERAIGFDRRAGLVPAPALAADRCTGCGFCVGVCPGSAIALTQGARPGAGA